MKDIQLNSLRVAALIFSGVFILLTLVFQLLPGKYRVSVEVAAHPDFFIQSQPPQHASLQMSTLLPIIILQDQKETLQLEEHVRIIPVNHLFNKKVLKKLRNKQHFVLAKHPEIAQAAAYLLHQCGIPAKPICIKHDFQLSDNIKINAESIAEPEKMKYNYRQYIKQIDATPQFKIDKRTEVIQRSGC